MAPELRKRSKSKTNVEPAAKKAQVPKRQAVEDASPVSVKKQKTVKETAKPKKTATNPPPVSAVKKTKKVTKSKPEKEPEEESEEEVETENLETDLVPADDGDDGVSDSDDDIDADIQALAAGLDPEDDDGRTGDGPGFQPGQDVGKIPKHLTKKEKNALASKEEPGVCYIGRLPHGFYEHELKAYASQFGPITRVRVSRNKHTGKSKHYAFIEFAEQSTAEVFAKTMDKYLLFSHILRVKVVPKDQLHPEIWKGANRRFKKTPWNKIAGKKLERPLSESAWGDKISREEKRRVERAQMLKDIGYDYEAPQLKQAPAPSSASDGIEEGDKPKAIEATQVTEVKEANGDEKEGGVAEAKKATAKKTKTKKKQVKA